MNRLIEDEELKQKINELVIAKKAGEELAKGPRIPVISNFIDHEIKRLEQKQFAAALDKQPVETLNELFRSTLAEVWEQDTNDQPTTAALLPDNLSHSTGREAAALTHNIVPAPG